LGELLGGLNEVFRVIGEVTLKIKFPINVGGIFSSGSLEVEI
jgi:hypothetical protein